MKRKRSILGRIIDIIITPYIWVAERKPVTQFAIVIGFFMAIIAATAIFHAESRTESDCTSYLELCVRQYNTCMGHAK